MAITAGRSATTAQTISTSYETAFTTATHGTGANLIEINCITESVIVQINDGAEFLVSAGEKVYRRAKSPNGIIKVAVKRGASADADLTWDVDVIV